MVKNAMIRFSKSYAGLNDLSNAQINTICTLREKTELSGDSTALDWYVNQIKSRRAWLASRKEQA